VIPSSDSETMSAKEVLSLRNTNETAGFEDEEEDLKWKERRGRTLSVAFDSFDSELGRVPSQLDLCAGGEFEPSGFSHPCEVVNSQREKLTGLTQAFETPATGEKVRLPICPENGLAGYTETQIKPFTVTDIVDCECNSDIGEEGKGIRAKKEQRPKPLSKSAVKWVYLQIWIYFYGFRLALVTLFAIGLTATIVGFWLGFDRTVVYLPLNLSLGLAFLVLVIRAVHYFTQPDQREKELPYSGFVGFRERIHDANLQSNDAW